MSKTSHPSIVTGPTPSDLERSSVLHDDVERAEHGEPTATETVHPMQEEDMEHHLQHENLENTKPFGVVMISYLAILLVAVLAVLWILF